MLVLRDFDSFVYIGMAKLELTEHYDQQETFCQCTGKIIVERDTFCRQAKNKCMSTVGEQADRSRIRGKFQM